MDSMIVNELIKELQQIVLLHPEVGEHKVALQDYNSEPQASEGINVYYGATYYQTETGGWLDPEEVEGEVKEEFPVLVIECF